jgi:hypothetical protein
MRRFAFIALLAVLLQSAAAQRMGGTPHFAEHFGAQGAAFGRHSFAYPVPFFSDSLYSGAVYPPSYAPAPPTIIVMQPAPPADPEPARAPAQPLLIELRGDRYVRISGEDSSGAQMIDQPAVSERTPESVGRVPSRAVLVFRDGRSEEVTDYTIADGILYARGNYYTDGSWNRKIEVSSLNLPETIRANHSRGVKFQLPAFSNEVIVGP